MWGIVGKEKDSAFVDMARDENMHQLDFEDYEDAVKYAEEQGYETYEIVLTSHTSKLARKVMGVTEYATIKR